MNNNIINMNETWFSNQLAWLLDLFIKKENTLWQE